MIFDGAIAQLGERLPCTQEVSSSILLSSTIFKCSSLRILKNGFESLFALENMLFNNLES